MAEEGIIYLASPYSHSNPAVKAARINAILDCATQLIKSGFIVFSPLIHSYPIAQRGLPEDWNFWERQDRAFIKACSEVWIVALEGWSESIGIRGEVRIARELGINIKVLESYENGILKLRDLRKDELV